MRLRSLLCAILLSVPATGSAVGANSEDHAISLRWSNGSVAPRYYYRSKITVAGTGRSSISVDLGTPPVAHERLVWKFEPDATEVDALWNFVHGSHFDALSNPPDSASTPERTAASGELCELTLLLHGNRHLIPCSNAGAQQLMTMMRALVPEPIARQIVAANAKFAARETSPRNIAAP